MLTRKPTQKRQFSNEETNNNSQHTLTHRTGLFNDCISYILGYRTLLVVSYIVKMHGKKKAFFYRCSSNVRTNWKHAHTHTLSLPMYMLENVTFFRGFKADLSKCKREQCSLSTYTRFKKRHIEKKKNSSQMTRKMPKIFNQEQRILH